MRASTRPRYRPVMTGVPMPMRPSLAVSLLDNDRRARRCLVTSKAMSAAALTPSADFSAELDAKEDAGADRRPAKPRAQ
jgi:hypothetical protein